MKKLTFLPFILLYSTLLNASFADGENKQISLQESSQQTRNKGKKNILMKTLGGRQLWGDLLFFRGWKIQQNVLTKHYRLLDEKDIRHAWGTLKACQTKLNDIKKKQHLKPMKGKVVVLIHGIMRSSKSFSKFNKELRKRGYTVCSFEYPSTRVSIPESAEYLHQTLESLEGVEEIYFVVHSMGGLVVRSYLKKHKDKRIQRMVMLGVPNKGANMADRLAKTKFYKWFYGPAGKQLMTSKKKGNKEKGFVDSLPTPSFEFGIIAGGRGNMKGYNPLIPGDDDGTVSVSSARLPGATDFILSHSLHSFLMFNDDVIQQTHRFLKEGHFRKNGKPHPIPKEKRASSSLK